MKIQTYLHRAASARRRLIFCMTILVGCAGEFARGDGQVEDLLQRGDAFDEQHRNAEALPYFIEANTLRPDDSEILRRIAKQYSQMMDGADSRSEARRLGRKSVEYAEASVRADPNNAKARLGLAICYGRVAFLESPRSQMEYSRSVLREAEYAVRLDPQNDLAWHVLGRWHYEMANLNPALRTIAEAIYGRLPEASNETAIESFQKAIRQKPRRVMHHIELGRAYAAVGETDLARRHIEEGLALPSTEKDDEETKARGRETLRVL